MINLFNNFQKDIKINIEKQLKQIERKFKKDKKVDIKKAIINAKKEIDKCYINEQPFDFYIKRYRKITKNARLQYSVEAVFVSVLATLMYTGMDMLSTMIVGDSSETNSALSAIEFIKNICTADTKLSYKIIGIIILLFLLAAFAFAICLFVIVAMKLILRNTYSDYENFVQPYEIEKLKNIIENQTKPGLHKVKALAKRVK